MSSTKQLFKNTSIYTFVSFLQKAMGFFLLPLYTYYLSTNEYGIIGTITSITAFLSIFYLLSLNGAASRFYFIYKDDPKKVKELWGTVFVVITLISILITILLVIGRNSILVPLMKGIRFYPYMAIALATTALTPTYSYYQSTLQTRQLSKRYALNNFVFFIVNISLILFFIIGLKMKSEGYLLAGLITIVVFYIYTLIRFIPEMRITINREILKDCFKYALPLIPHSVASWVIVMVDRVFINNLQSTSWAGIYTVGLQFGMIITLFTNSVNQAYIPWFMHALDESEENKEKIVRVTEFSVVAYAAIAFTLSMCSREIMDIMVSGQFKGGWVVVPFISFMYVFEGFYFFFVSGLFYHLKGTKYVSVITITSAIINFVLNFLLIPKWGIVGAAFSGFISMFVVSIIAKLISGKFDKIKYNVVRMYAIGIVLFIIPVILLIWQNSVSLIVRLLVFLVVMLILALIYGKDVKIVLKSGWWLN